MSQTYAAEDYFAQDYAAGPGAVFDLTDRVRIRRSTMQAQVFLTIGPPTPQVEYEFSGGRTFKEPS